jgi:hypothetical protein
VAEIRHLRDRQEGGRVKGAAPTRSFRLIAANDNQPPGRSWRDWWRLILVVSVLIAFGLWVGGL